MYNQGLFYSWIPRPVVLILCAVIGIVFFMITPIYTTNVSYMASSTGNMSEYYVWANYCGVIGMGVIMPILVRVNARFRVKEIVITCFVTIALMYYIMATTEQVEVILACSFFMGVFKMLGTMQALIPLMAVVSKIANRGVFYAFLYTGSLVESQLSSYIMTRISYFKNWQTAYITMAIVCLVSALVCVLIMHNQRFMKKVPLYYIDWLSILLYSASFVLLGYVLSFGKQQDWFNSTKILYATIGSGVSAFAFILRQQLLKRPFLSLKPFRRTTVLHGIVLLFLLGMYLATINIQNIYAVSILGYNYLTNASLTLMLLPGMFLGMIVCFQFFMRGYSLSVLAFSGFASFMFYCLFMYFGMSLQFSYDMWYIPMFFKGYGMIVLFVVIWFYTLNGLEILNLLSLFGFAMLWRTYISVGIFSALYSWAHYALQQQSISNLAVYLDSVLMMDANKGISLQAVQVNAILAATKTLYGYISMASIAALLYVSFVHVSTKTTSKLSFRFVNGKIRLNKKDFKSINKLFKSKNR